MCSFSGESYNFVLSYLVYNLAPPYIHLSFYHDPSMRIQLMVGGVDDAILDI